MSPDRAEAAPTVAVRDKETLRNSWKCAFWKQDSDPVPGWLVLTNQRILAYEGTGGGFWAGTPRQWVVVVDRNLADVPPIARSDESDGEIYLFIAGHALKLRTAPAHAALSDIEHARLQALALAAPPRVGPHEKEVVIKEVVKIPCRYCGNLNLQADKKCASCGAATG